MASYVINDFLVNRELERLSQRLGFNQTLIIPNDGALNLKVGSLSLSLEFNDTHSALLVSSSVDISKDEKLLENALAFSAYNQPHFKVITVAFVEPYLMLIVHFTGADLSAENLERTFLELVRINEEICS